MTADELLREALPYLNDLLNAQMRAGYSGASLSQVIARIDAHLASGGQSLDAQEVAERVREACASACRNDESGRDSGGYFAELIESIEIKDILK